VGRVGAAPTAGWCGEALFWQQWRRGLRDDRHRANCTHRFHAQRASLVRAQPPFRMTRRAAVTRLSPNSGHLAGPASPFAARQPHVRVVALAQRAPRSVPGDLSCCTRALGSEQFPSEGLVSRRCGTGGASARPPREQHSALSQAEASASFAWVAAAPENPRPDLRSGQPNRGHVLPLARRGGCRGLDLQSSCGVLGPPHPSFCKWSRRFFPNFPCCRPGAPSELDMPSSRPN